MKKLVLALAVATSSLTFAQQFGVKAGMNLSTISNVDNIVETGVDSKSKVGFNVGVFANVPLSGEFSLQPEVLYNSVGAKLTGKGSESNKDALTLNLDYVSVPVMLQYNFITVR